MNRNLSKIIIIIFLIAGIFVAMYPFLVMIGNSFEVFTFSLPNPPRIFPKEFTLDNYKEVIFDYEIYKYFFNSFSITILTTTFVIMLSALSAYAFAKIPFIGRNVLFKVYLFTLMIPGVLNIIPQFLTINSMSLIGTRAGLILLYVGTGICGNTFFLKGFFQQIQNELLESVFIDGGNHFTVFRKIVVPLAKPAIATLAVLTFLGTWDDFFTAKVILASNQNVLTLPIIIHRINGQHATKFGLVFAASIITLVPVIVLYIVAQKYFIVGGLTEGAVKE